MKKNHRYYFYHVTGYSSTVTILFAEKLLEKVQNINLKLSRPSPFYKLCIWIVFMHLWNCLVMGRVRHTFGLENSPAAALLSMFKCKIQNIYQNKNDYGGASCICFTISSFWRLQINLRRTHLCFSTEHTHIRTYPRRTWYPLLKWQIQPISYLLPVCRESHR